MILHLDPDRLYSNRDYLTEWFRTDTLVVTDNDAENPPYAASLVGSQKYIFDITHNPFPDYFSDLEKHADLILTNNFKFWYNPEPKRMFFPLFLWMYSLRKPLWYHMTPVFDASNEKTQGFMCLNKMPRTHRTLLREEFNRRNLIKYMMYTFVGHNTLPDETPEQVRLQNDIGVGHPAYSQYAVNIVTETDVNVPYISEKTCKPFVARQIPLIVGSQGVNKFLSDIGLDMFEDIIPWQTWDSEPELTTRLEKIVDCVETWILYGDIVRNYKNVRKRVERNKKYFHSEEFRNILMRQMHQFN
jgi:hypothetical protein